MLGATIIPTGPYRWVEWFQALPHRVVHWSNQSHRGMDGMDCSFCYVFFACPKNCADFVGFSWAIRCMIWPYLTRLELRNSQHETKFSCAGGNTICTISHSRFLSKWQHPSSSPLGMFKQYLVELKMLMQWIVFLSGLPKKHEKMHTSRRIQRWSFGGRSLSYRSMWLDVFSLSSYTAMGLASPSGRRACAAAAVLMVMLPHMLNPVGASDSIITCVIHVHVCRYLKQSILGRQMHRLDRQHQH